MKLLFISDIHGNLAALKKVINYYNQNDFDQILILGDILYHGPRNPLTDGYDSMGVAKLLNQYADKIVAIRGNCDSEVDQMILDFSIMDTKALVYYQNKKIILSHGHIYNEDHYHGLYDFDILCNGHTHVHQIKKRDDKIFFNPGSIALPKNNQVASFGTLEDNQLKIIDLDGNVLDCESIEYEGK